MKKLGTHNEFVEAMKIINPEMTVIGHYDGRMKTIRMKHICGYEWDSIPFNMLQGRGCPMCNHAVKKTQEMFIDEVAEVDDNIEVIGQYVSNKTKIKIRYKNCGHEHEMRPSDILNGERCPYCASRKILVGFNDIATTDPWMVKYMVDPEDGKRYMRNSKSKILCQCPECGYQEQKTIASIFNHGYYCSFCDDGLSYPNKFSREMLRQLPVEKTYTEYSPDWAGKKKYDNYFQFNNMEYILEMDGGFHYEERGFQPLSEIQERDRLKDDLAREHGLIMIRIDCRKSDKDYIVNNIKQSILGQLFDLSNIDWDRCDVAGSRSIIKQCCEFYENNKNNMLIKDICKHLGVSASTLIAYRKIGVSAGWCTYSDEDKNNIRINNTGKSVSLPIIVYNDKHIKIHEFKSINACKEYMCANYDVQFSYGGIKDHCINGTIFKCFYFEYADK